MNQQVRVDVPEQTDFRARFTTAEFLRMAEAGAFDDMKVELIEGELERITPAQGDHGLQQMRVGLKLGQVVSWDRLTGEISIDLGNDTIVGCDVALLREGATGVGLAPAATILLTVEVAVSTVARDMNLKRLAYAGAGIPHYWVVDSKEGVTHVYGDPIDGEYKSLLHVPFGCDLAVPGTDASIILD